MSGDEDSPREKTAILAEPEFVGDEDEFVPVAADGVDLSPSAGGGSLTGESRDEETAPVPAEDEWLGPASPVVPVPQATPICGLQAPGDPPKGADHPPAELRERLGSGGQPRAEWPEDSAVSQVDEMQADAGPWEDLATDGEGSGGAQEPGPVYKEGNDGELEPADMDGSGSEEQVLVKTVEGFQEDLLNETAAKESSNQNPQTPGNVLPDHGEIPEATQRQSQWGEPEVADREERDGSSLELQLQLERSCAWTDGELPEGLTLRGEAGESEEGRGEACPPWDESEEDSVSVRQVEAPSLPATPGEEEEKLSGKGLSPERGETGRVDLVLSPLPEITGRDNWPEEGEEPSPVTTNGHQLNGLHGYREATAPATAPAKGEGSTAEMIAAAYHYWSSEDE